MAIIDPTTVVGKLRLRCGDTSDLPMLSDDVYQTTYTDCNNSLSRATSTCAQYILALLSQNTHSKLVQIEVWGSEAFNNYMTFLTKVVLNPSVSQTCPIPYSASNNKTHSLVQFQDDWYEGFVAGTQSEQMELDNSAKSEAWIPV